MRAKDIVIIGMMSAVLITLQVTLSFLPNIELVSLFIILYTLIFGRKTIFIIYVFVAVEGMIYGIGPWWINYLYVWTVLFLVAHLLRKQNFAFLWATVAGCYGLGFGALCAIPYFITGGAASGFAYWVSGIPFDITHGIANFVVTLVLYLPLYRILNKVNERFELS
jgi:energy-coupling factor transport system substrate-specific component